MRSDTLRMHTPTAVPWHLLGACGHGREGLVRSGIKNCRAGVGIGAALSQSRQCPTSSHSRGRVGTRPVPRRLPAIASKTMSSASHVTTSHRRTRVAFVGSRARMARMLRTTSPPSALFGRRTLEGRYAAARTVTSHIVFNMSARTKIGWELRPGMILTVLRPLYARRHTATPLYHVCRVYCLPLCSNMVSPRCSASAFAVL